MGNESQKCILAKCSNLNQDAMHRCLARFYYFRKLDHDQPHLALYSKDEVSEQLCQLREMG